MTYQSDSNQLLKFYGKVILFKSVLSLSEYLKPTSDKNVRLEMNIGTSDIKKELWRLLEIKCKVILAYDNYFCSCCMNIFSTDNIRSITSQMEGKVTL